jgi:hypothetical protein
MLRIAPHISWHAVEGELALFDTRDGSYHALNPTAADIWRGIAEEVPLESLAASLATRYAAPREAVAAGVREFVGEALAKGLLVQD